MLFGPSNDQITALKKPRMIGPHKFFLKFLKKRQKKLSLFPCFSTWFRTSMQPIIYLILRTKYYNINTIFSKIYYAYHLSRSELLEVINRILCLTRSACTSNYFIVLLHKTRDLLLWMWFQPQKLVLWRDDSRFWFYSSNVIFCVRIRHGRIILIMNYLYLYIIFSGSRTLATCLLPHIGNHIRSKRNDCKTSLRFVNSFLFIWFFLVFAWPAPLSVLFW